MSSDLFLTLLPSLTNWVNKFVDLLSAKIADWLGDVAGNIARKIFANGFYEVLDYEATLEILNAKGTKATFRKTIKVRYLQDNIIAFQDYAWGDGIILLNYHTSRGKPVDLYRSGFKTYILLSLREVKNTGETDEFNIQWDICQGFLTPDGYWGADTSQRTHHVKINVIFPKRRPPLHLAIEENSHRRTRALNQDNQKQLADGRWLVTWEMVNPKLHELYVVRWLW